MISINIEVNHGCWRRKINAINYDVYHENIQILYASSGGKTPDNEQFELCSNVLPDMNLVCWMSKSLNWLI
jgi:hypothetical protein